MKLHPNRRFREAFAWSLLADVVRRHQVDANLQIYAWHPGGGQYDLRSIFVREDGVKLGGRALINFHIHSGAWHVVDHISRPRPLDGWATQIDLQGDQPIPFVELMTSAPHRLEVVRMIEALIGLPPVSNTPPLGRKSFSYRVISEVLARRLTGGPELSWWQGFEDSSGMTDCSVNSDANHFPSLLRHQEYLDRPNTEGTPLLDKSIVRTWILRSRESHSPKLAITDDGWLHTKRGESMDLFSRLTRHSMDAVVNELLEHTMS